MATRIAMQRELSRRLYADSHDPITGTTTSTTATEVTDLLGGLNYSTGDVNAFDRKYVQLMEAADASLRGVSRVIEAGWALTGTLTVDPAFAVTPVSGDIFIISDHPPAVLQSAINAVQRNLFFETFFPLSYHVMGNDANDMEPSTIATDYSATNGTRATESTIVKHGAQSLKLTATSAGGYANTGNIGVPESQSLHAAVDCYVTSGDSGTFRVVDVTNSSATIEDATTDEPSWMDLVIQFSTPSGCEQIDFRMISDADTDITYWENFQLWSSGRRVYSLPSWITRPEQLLDVRSFAQGTGGPASDNDYRSNETRSQPLSYGFENVDRRGNLPLHIWVDAGSARPFIYALRPLDELSADTSNSVAEQDFIVRWAEKLVREPDKASETMALLRAIHFQRVTTELPNRIGVSM
ncbi:hypothetical protein LCGC14_1633140 [marine sediment metagenome]|uniref:Uncharacterized protein n=1 Tax=marine sediment metagenome TaxID=412755 RepID=A0A0F9I2B0_9ZZZZ